MGGVGVGAATTTTQAAAAVAHLASLAQPRDVTHSSFVARISLKPVVVEMARRCRQVESRRERKKGTTASLLLWRIRSSSDANDSDGGNSGGRC